MPTATGTGATVEIDEMALAQDVAARVVEVTVDQDVRLPAGFEIRFIDQDRKATEGVPVRIGSRVKLTGAAVGGEPKQILSGEVTAIEADYAPGGSYLIVRGYDMAHRLHRGRKSKAYTQVMYSDVAQQIASEAGLTAGTIDSSGAVKDHVPQVAQSDWEFLSELAAEIDFELSVEDGALDFHAPTEASDSPGEGTYGSKLPLQLIFGEDLLEFRPRLSAAGQVDSVEVRAWDWQNKQALVGTASAASNAASLTEDPAALSGIFGGATMVSIEPRAVDQSSADKRASRIAQQIGTTFAEATGVARGNPEIRAGRSVSISVVGGDFVGSYALSHTRHVFDAHGYRTQFVAGGRQDRSLLGLVRGATASAAPAAGPGSAGGAASNPLSRIGGVVTGVVSDVQDPLKMARVKLQLPWLDGSFVSDWARVAMPGAGNARGLVWLPEVGDEVLVAFEQGDVRRPIVIGGLWNGTDTPPPYGLENGQENARALVSLQGHKVVLHDSDDGGSIEVATPKGLTIVLDEANNKITVKAGNGAKLAISAEGDVDIEAGGQLSIKAGTNLSVHASSGLDLKSDATATLKGAMVQIN
jgi:phage protein D/phage baseplate assembly protein gpV